MPLSSPLSGVKVVDAASYITGPFAAAMLSDLGAEVIRIEPPGGDPHRRMGRAEAGLAMQFAHVNRGKRSVVADLKTPAGQETLAGQLADADVFITNWRTGVADRLGLTEASVRSRFPRLIWVRITGFGISGPRAHAPTFDPIIQAQTGLMYTQGTDARPQMMHSNVADKVTSCLAAQAALAALVARGAAGPGEIVDLAMLDAMSYFNAPDVLNERTRLADTAERPDSVNRMLGAVRAVPTADGWVLIAPARGKQVKGCLAAVGHPEWMDELRLVTDPAVRTERIYDLLQTVTPSRTTADWLAVFVIHDVPASDVLDIDGHLDDPQVAENETYAVVDDDLWGPTRFARHPARFAGRPLHHPGLVPHLPD
jgi:crotonobetainyl-CoA:carnitine CoA-transferase CaiB-like acyl-CoA transferase